MHSMELASGVTVHYNGDFSGKVIFDGVHEDFSVEIEFADLEEVFMHSRRRALITRLENMDTKQLKEYFFGTQR